MPPVALPSSKRQIDLAGERVREWWGDPSQPDEKLRSDLQLNEAMALVYRFRMGFQLPLSKVTTGLRTVVEREAEQVIVSQRLKRLPTILDKLTRYPSMNLSRMQDIGGCRAILADRAEVERLLRWIRRRWDVRRLDDYVLAPKPTGYRAVHAIVLRDGRLIEIQLRTPLQQEWAALVDHIGGNLGVHLKDGEGPTDLVRLLRLLADRTALREGGVVADDYSEQEFFALREKVFPKG